MNDKYVLDDNGNPQACDNLMTWGKWIGDPENIKKKRVGKTVFGDVEVSTVFLGIDHSFGSGEPLLYETMIFGGEHDGYMDRYSTKAEAIEGHQKAVNLIKHNQ